MTASQPHLNNTLDVLHRAALLVASETALDNVLQQITSVACELVNARYSAIGVAGEDGYFNDFHFSGIPDEVSSRMAHQPNGEGLLGFVIREQAPVRVKDIAADPRSFGLPENHPEIRSFLGVPLLVDGESVGNLYLAEKIGADQFSADDQRLIEMLASHAAVAIAKARLYEQVEELAIAAERSRIGMDLHDGIIQSIFAVGLTLEATRLAIEKENNDAPRLLQSAVDQLNSTIGDIRNFIMDLRPRNFNGDLLHGVGQLAREFQANTHVPITLDLPSNGIDLPEATALALFLTIQEALANIARHAAATDVLLTLTHSAEKIIVTIVDNGCGFNPDTLDAFRGHGLSTMRSRAERLNGVCIIDSEPADGTQITITIPTS